MHAEADTRWAASARSVLEVFALRACGQPEEKDEQALLERVAELENRLAELEKNGVRAPAGAVETKIRAPKVTAPALRPVTESPVPEGSKLPKDIWNDALKLLKKTEPAIFGPLSQGKYGGYQNGVYRAYFSADVEFMMTMLSLPGRKEKIVNALNQCGASNAAFEALTAEAPQDPEKKQREENNLSGLIDMFGRDKVQIDE